MDFAAQPINYAGAFQGQPTMAQDLTQGVQAGVGIQYAGMQQAMQQYQFQRMRQMQAATAQVAQNPTLQNIAQLSIAFPEMSEQFKRSFDMLQPAQQQARLQAMTPVFAAMQNGRYDVASQLLNDRADALDASGQQQEAQQLRAMAQMVTNHPETANMTAGLLLATAMGPDKFNDTFKGTQGTEQAYATEPSAVGKAGAEALTAQANAATQFGLNQANINKINTDATVSAGRLQLDKDALVTNTQTKLRELQLQYGTPDDATAKQISDAALGGSQNELFASRMNNIADQMEQASRAQGFAGTAAEAYKRFTGSGDGVTALKQIYAQAVNQQALGQIKDALGGRVTDVDMKMAMGSVPDANASTEVVSSYLRGVAKLSNLQAALQNAQAEWLSQQGFRGNLGPARQDMVVEGTKVPQGTSFSDFSRQFIQQKAEQISAQQALVQSQGRSYMRWANPGQAGPAGGAFPTPGGADASSAPVLGSGRYQ